MALVAVFESFIQQSIEGDSNRHAFCETLFFSKIGKVLVALTWSGDLVMFL